MLVERQALAIRCGSVIMPLPSVHEWQQRSSRSEDDAGLFEGAVWFRFRAEQPHKLLQALGSTFRNGKAVAGAITEASGAIGFPSVAGRVRCNFSERTCDA